MKKSRYKWKQITLGDFEDYCSEHPNSIYTLDYNQQDSAINKVPTTVFKAYFNTILIIHSPRRVILKNGNSYVQFLFIDNIHIAKEPTELGQPFMIVCDNPARTEKDKYTIIIQPKE